MMYWPRPSELKFELSRQAALKGLSVVKADILSVDQCWRQSTPVEYVPRLQVYHSEEIDQTARDYLLRVYDRLEIPEVLMLGNQHIAFQRGAYLFSLLREMADLGYLSRIPFAVPPWDEEKFRFHFCPKNSESAPFVECPTLDRQGVLVIR